MLSRFSPSTNICNPVWLHACSVGEVNLISPLVRLWKDFFPSTKLLITSSTATGYDQAKRKYASLCEEVCFCPFDHPRVVSKFFTSIKPCLLILTETEIWPNLILTGKKEGVPIVVINGRISDKAFRRYKALRFALKEIFRSIDFVFAQSDEYASRFEALGVLPERIQVAGNMKYDAIPTEVSPSVRNKIKVELGIPNDGIVIVFGSLRDGDEKVAKFIWDELKEKINNMWLILVPRHPEKKGKILDCFADEKIILRTDNLKGIKSEGRIVVVDTIGELTSFYSIASIAIIGGSWLPGVEGHNPLEPAGLGVVSIFGKYMRNFQEPAEKLVSGKGAIQVQDFREIPFLVESLLREPYEYINFGTRAREIVLQNQGVSNKILMQIAKFLD
ncbi:MAG: 3-deoxy-D-manno-octulosonic acid transferase [Candidatus Hydrogenedentes bacterium]|nr:3-deoxy-D-manno-octulosonic acid transferase [Candidatus Hydrogenedentota bacterium]